MPNANTLFMSDYVHEDSQLIDSWSGRFSGQNGTGCILTQTEVVATAEILPHACSHGVFTEPWKTSEK